MKSEFLRSRSFFTFVVIVTALLAAAASGVASASFMVFLQEHTPLDRNWILLAGTAFLVAGFLSLLYLPFRIRRALIHSGPSNGFLEALFLPMGFLAARSGGYRRSQESYLTFVCTGVLRLGEGRQRAALRYYHAGRNSTSQQARDVLVRLHAYWFTPQERRRLFLWQMGAVYYWGYYFADPSFTLPLADVGLFRRENELFRMLALWYGIDDHEQRELFELLCRIYGYGGYESRGKNEGDQWRGGDGWQWGPGSHGISMPSRREIRKACRILGIDPGSPLETARKAYRRLMIQNHPDRAAAAGLSPDQVRCQTAITQEIQEAWNVVRSQYGEQGQS